MDKFLFTDGNTGVKEIHSRQELQQLIDASEDPEKIRIWVFNSSEWISYKTYRNTYGTKLLENRARPADVNRATSNTNRSDTVARSRKHTWLKNFLFLLVLSACALLVFNFTRISWEKKDSVSINAIRPGNMPVMDIDSLVWSIEMQRGQKLDRSTRTNLRLRNTWPERLLVQLNASRETNRKQESRFSDIELSIDNTTGFTIDNVALKIISWRNNSKVNSDTIQFSNVEYEGPIYRVMNNHFGGDSITVSIESIRAKSFNFCYSADAQNEDNHYDPWFCRDN